MGFAADKRGAGFFLIVWRGGFGDRPRRGSGLTGGPFSTGGCAAGRFQPGGSPGGAGGAGRWVSFASWMAFWAAFARAGCSCMGGGRRLERRGVDGGGGGGVGPGLA